MGRLGKAWQPVLSGLLLTLAFPPFNLRLLVFVALAPLLMGLTKLGPKGSFKAGYLFGFVFLAGQFHWIGVLTTRWTGSDFLGFVPWVICCFLGSFYFGLIGWLLWICWDKRIPLMMPLAWAGVEVFRSYIPVFAFPWGLLPSPLWPYPAILQTASFGMVYLVSAWIVLGNLLITQSLIRLGQYRRREPAPPSRFGIPFSLPGAAIFFFLVGASQAHYYLPISGFPFRLTIAQPGVDLAFGDRQTNRLEVFQRVLGFEDLARRQGSRLLVLPEGIAEGMSLPKDPAVPMIYGGQRGTGPFYQSAFAAEGDTEKYVDKTRLVIFGEFVPGRNVLPFLNKFNLPAGDLSAGTSIESMEIAGFRVGPIICFEGLFPDIAYKQQLNGAQLLAVLSVDDWYMGTGAPEQLKSGSVFRAIETGLPLARSATQGYTMAIDQRGRVIAEAPLAKPDALTVDLILPRPAAGESPYRFVFPLLALFSIPVLITVRVISRLNGQPS